MTLAQSLKSPLLWLVGFGALGPVVRQDYRGERAQMTKAAHLWRARDEEKERIWTDMSFRGMHHGPSSLAYSPVPDRLSAMSLSIDEALIPLDSSPN